MHHPGPSLLLRLALLLLTAALALSLPGCSSDSSAPPAGDPDGTGGVLAEGSFDPDAEMFVLETLSIGPDGMLRVPVQLVGRNLTVLVDSMQVTLEVAVRNQHDEPLYAPALVAVSQLGPAAVVPLNPDHVVVPMDPTGSPLGEVEYVWLYSEHLGDDGVLDPGETSEFRAWTFLDPGLVPFSFGARAEFGLQPDAARIGGVCFWDSDLDGLFGPDDHPLTMGVVVLRTPGGESVDHWFEDPLGRYSIPVTETGLYELSFDPLIDTFAPLVFTTPNPRSVLLTPNADGEPNSYLDAHFGLGNAPLEWPEPIQFSEDPPDSLHRFPWSFIEAELLPDRVLRMHVGHSGCDMVQPASLYMSGGFRESEPPQAALVFVNESLDDCDAWFENNYFFDLGPLWMSYAEAYGPGLLILNLIDYDGEIHRLEMPVFPED